MHDWGWCVVGSRGGVESGKAVHVLFDFARER